jgi:hypothetical protein
VCRNFFQFKQSKKPQKKQTLRFSKALSDAYSNHRRVCAEWRKAGRPCAAEHPAKAANLNSQRLIQKLLSDEESDKAKTQHEELMDTQNKNISDVYKKLKKINGDTVKSSDIGEIQTFLGLYKGKNVLEDSRANTEHLCNEKSDKPFSDDFLNRCDDDLVIINDIAEDEALEIPPITLQKLQEIIFKKLKANKACDIYKLSTEHLRYAGDKVLTLLCTFINRVLENMNYLAAAASVIYKGKDKPKQHHKSYRLVRVCHLIGRIIDEHIGPMAVEISKPLQSINQYGFTENITYLMGALQRHEAQKYCIDSKKTFFGCSLDGDSAFEVVSRTIQKRKLYFAGEVGQLSQYNSSCYQNTQMNGKISKSLEERLGVGQGKIKSSDHYKIYIYPVLETLEGAKLGVIIGPINTGVSCVADDLYLISGDQVKLQGLIIKIPWVIKTHRLSVHSN